MRFLASTFCIAAALSAGLAAVSEAANMRVSLNASVATGCSVSEVDAEAWALGQLRVNTRCNSERFSLRLMSGSETLDISEVTANGAADIRVRDGFIWVTQTRPGELSFELAIEDVFALQAQPLSVRLDAL